MDFHARAKENKEVKDLMTREKETEALNYITSQLKYGYIDLSSHDEDELELVEQAINKQVPQKVISYGYIYGYAHRCPVCNHLVYEGAYGEQAKYCHECGQALDWSEDNDA